MSHSVLIAPAASGEIATLFVGFELSKSTWLIGLYAPELGKTISHHKVEGGDVSSALELIDAARRRLESAGRPVRAVSVYEAGYDGFWLRRMLTEAGIENRVIDAASIPVDRRSRRAKTDRLDLELLIRMLLALERGETRICRVVQVPSPAEEDAKRSHRERAVLVAARTAHSNRMTGILMAFGIRGVNPRRRDFVEQLEKLVTATGERLPPYTKQALVREYERLKLVERQVKEIERAQAAAMKGHLRDRDRLPQAVQRDENICRAGLPMTFEHYAQTRRPSLFACLNEDFRIEAQLSTDRQHRAERLDGQQVLALIVNDTAAINLVTFDRDSPGVEICPPTLRHGADDISMAIDQHGR